MNRTDARFTLIREQPRPLALVTGLLAGVAVFLYGTIGHRAARYL